MATGHCKLAVRPRKCSAAGRGSGSIQVCGGIIRAACLRRAVPPGGPEWMQPCAELAEEATWYW